MIDLDELERIHARIMAMRGDQERRRDLCEETLCDDVITDLLTLARIGQAAVNLKLLLAADDYDQFASQQKTLEQLRSDFIAKGKP